MPLTNYLGYDVDLLLHILIDFINVNLTLGYILFLFGDDGFVEILDLDKIILIDIICFRFMFVL